MGRRRICIIVVAQLRCRGQVPRELPTEKLVYEVYPEFDWADPAGSVSSSEDMQERRRVGGNILVHETVLITWEGGERDMFTIRIYVLPAS